MRVRFTGESVICLAALAVLVVSGARAAAEPVLAAERIVVERDLRYREAGGPHCTVDVAREKDYQGPPRPALLVIHGGGWIEGDKSSFATLENRNPASIIDFVRLGFVAVGVNYRLAGEAPYPAGLDDCRAAVRWLRAHAQEYRVDPARIGAYGNSAGGHLALLLGLMPPTTPAAGEPFAGESSAVQAVASDSGPLDLARQHRDNQLRTVIERFMGGPPEDARASQYRLASPISHVNPGAPPLLLIYGDADSQVNVTITDQFVSALSQAGHKRITYIRLSGVDHCPHSLVGVPYLRTVVDDFFLSALGVR